MTPNARRAAGMIDANGSWTGKYGIHSRAQFLRDHVAQEKALTDYLRDIERQLRANGSFDFIGKAIDGIRDRFQITQAGLVAAAHREGARETRDYLQRMEENGFTSRGLVLSRQALAIETRIRTFAETLYEKTDRVSILQLAARTLLAFVCTSLCVSYAARAERVRFSNALSTDEIRCFRQLFEASHWNIMPQWEDEMLSDAKVGRVDLNNDHRKEHVYLIEGTGWCGSAGCKVLIGEADTNGLCRLLYDDDGSGNFLLLRRRDHGYRRLYTPCEARFDGQRYRQIHPECPTVDIPR